MDFTGKIIFALPAKSGLKKNGESWKSQEFVIENIEGQYPKKMCFNVFGEDKINSFDIKLGEELKVSFDVDAKQWQERAQKVHVFDAVDIRQMPEQRRANPAKTEDQSEEHPGNHADIARHQFLCVHHDGRKG